MYVRPVDGTVQLDVVRANAQSTIDVAHAAHDAATNSTVVPPRVFAQFAHHSVSTFPVSINPPDNTPPLLNFLK